MRAQEAALREAFETWWAEHSPSITALAHTQGTNGKHLSHLREELLESFRAALLPVGMLEASAVRGIIAGFWDQTKNDFRTLQARGAKGVIDAWRTSITTALEDKRNGASALDHKLVRLLLSDFVDELERLQSRVTELDSKIKAAESQPEEDEADDGEPDDDAPTEADIKAWKQER
ncbi:MAG: SAM-dependent DNA methyltransferase, partial [Halomonas sp.]